MNDDTLSTIADQTQRRLITVNHVSQALNTPRTQSGNQFKANCAYSKIYLLTYLHNVAVLIILIALGLFKQSFRTDYVDWKAIV